MAATRLHLQCHSRTPAPFGSRTPVVFDHRTVSSRVRGSHAHAERAAQPRTLLWRRCMSMSFGPGFGRPVGIRWSPALGRSGPLEESTNADERGGTLANAAANAVATTAYVNVFHIWNFPNGLLGPASGCAVIVRSRRVHSALSPDTGPALWKCPASGWVSRDGSTVP